MKIYISHASDFDYENQLYLPLRQSPLNEGHEIFFPHQSGNEQYAKEILKTFDLVVAEVTRPSTGQGIELGWADFLGIPIVCILESGAHASSSLKLVTKTFIEYDSIENMIEKLKAYLSPNT